MLVHPVRPGRQTLTLLAVPAVVVAGAVAGSALVLDIGATVVHGRDLAMMLTGFGAAALCGAAAGRARRRPRGTRIVASRHRRRPTVFVSYARQDADLVALLARDLEAGGYDVWRDVGSIEGGESWRAAIVAGLRHSVAVVLVLSPSSASSRQVVREVTLADDEGRPIVPLVLPGVDGVDDSLRYVLAGTEAIDMAALSRPQVVARVRTAIAAAGSRARTAHRALRPRRARIRRRGGHGGR